MSSRCRWATAVCAALLLAGCTSTSSPSSSPSLQEGARLSPEARGYLTEALDLMQQQSLRRAEVDWKTVRARAFDQAGTARTPAETYPAISGALGALNDHHSQFVPPDRAAQPGVVDGDNEVVDAPTSRQLPGRIGYLRLPRVNGSDRTYAEYGRQGRAAVAATDRVGACGWVVDLRDETGGGMWAPLAAAGPILGDGPVGGFLTPDGKHSVWSIRGGVPYEDDTPQASAEGVSPLAVPDPPVAVLTSRATGSAGEAVTLAFIGRPATRSFGGQTYGVPTGNAAHRLSDGAVIVLTGAAETDRTGRVHDGPIRPDEEVDAPTRKDSDPTLDAATAWLSTQPACKG
ncbi:S41 family peptidase [Kitasatospora sp. NPDC097643]|uniref:S41 family peptidase n=1 Tax=Kitasatospora sp. NPDC097643 TaxID=3157230 RepID=UPI0033180238